MTTLKVGIASYEEMQARTMAVERGERGRITPKLQHDRVALDPPLPLSRTAS